MYQPIYKPMEVHCGDWNQTRGRINCRALLMKRLQQDYSFILGDKHPRIFITFFTFDLTCTSSLYNPEFLDAIIWVSIISYFYERIRAFSPLAKPIERSFDYLQKANGWTGEMTLIIHSVSSQCECSLIERSWMLKCEPAFVAARLIPTTANENRNSDLITAHLHHFLTDNNKLFYLQNPLQYFQNILNLSGRRLDACRRKVNMLKTAANFKL
jgi:hypothetical protein